MNTSLETLIHEPATQASGSVIWLHGLGADGHDFANIAAQLNLPSSLRLRFLFPHAPVRRVTMNANLEMRAWFDIDSLERGSRIDIKGITEATALINALIQQEIDKGIEPNNIIIAGFSQGGAMALHCGLRYPEPLGGLLGLSTFLPLIDLAAKEKSEKNTHTPIFMAHGNADQILPLELGKTTAEALNKLGYSVEWHEYPMAHQVCLAEIEAISQWLQQRF